MSYRADAAARRLLKVALDSDRVFNKQAGFSDTLADFYDMLANSPGVQQAMKQQQARGPVAAPRPPVRAAKPRRAAGRPTGKNWEMGGLGQGYPAKYLQAPPSAPPAHPMPSRPAGNKQKVKQTLLSEAAVAGAEGGGKGGGKGAPKPAPAAASGLDQLLNHLRRNWGWYAGGAGALAGLAALRAWLRSRDDDDDED